MLKGEFSFRPFHPLFTMQLLKLNTKQQNKNIFIKTFWFLMCNVLEHGEILRELYPNSLNFNIKKFNENKHTQTQKPYSHTTNNRHKSIPKEQQAYSTTKTNSGQCVKQALKYLISSSNRRNQHIFNPCRALLVLFFIVLNFFIPLVNLLFPSSAARNTIITKLLIYTYLFVLDYSSEKQKQFQRINSSTKKLKQNNHKGHISNNQKNGDSLLTAIYKKTYQTRNTHKSFQKSNYITSIKINNQNCTGP
eukprot:TRINITY_DN1361_c0_g2_i3.p1 TRINITY_DN1361_c0_g2~~TRINITY_DN1361_c0_g2_i3.p1  ORF type:complete len:249 (+),score=-13.11 TRINITY_DN1361_c0_g2_i3:299-1045(+)